MSFLELLKEINESDEEEIKYSTEDILSLALCGSMNLIAALEIMMLGFLDAHPDQEDIKKLKSAFNVLNGAEIARGKRYSKKRILYSKAIDIAKEKWINGSELLHFQMKDWLIYDYESQNGKMPFTELSEKSLNAKLKGVLHEIDRPDLIHGFKKDAPPSP